MSLRTPCVLVEVVWDFHYELPTKTYLYFPYSSNLNIHPNTNREWRQFLLYSFILRVTIHAGASYNTVDSNPTFGNSLKIAARHYPAFSIFFLTKIMFSSSQIPEYLITIEESISTCPCLKLTHLLSCGLGEKVREPTLTRTSLKRCSIVPTLEEPHSLVHIISSLPTSIFVFQSSYES